MKQPTPPCFIHRSSVASAGARFLKPENSQLTGAFKERGALNKLLSLSPEQKGKGVVAAFAGNHAQAVAEGTGYLCENQCRF